ncbi:MAG: lysophospholipid transporter LplT, partial [Sulfurimicrobium sp.]|nr:lysophospholipid transporter LplT [Sulfurimicrobium sp.]
AKYGILTEYLPPNKLVLANSWMEGATVAAIVLGAIIGGILLNPALSSSLLAGWNLADSVSVSKFAVIIVTFLYISAAVFNLFIPRVAIDHKLPKKNPFYLLHDFWHSFILLWRDPQGQISLAVTTLFWGAGATLRLVVLTWAGLILKFDLEKATQLTAVVAVGIAVGAVVAGKFITLERSVKVLPTGILMGFTVMSMVLVDDWRIAVGLLFVIGALGGFFVVPMNALLQHRGHLLMGAGHSIAVQNFNENISILLLLGCYAMMVKSDMHINTITIVFGAFVSLSMWLINHRYKRVTAS